MTNRSPTHAFVLRGTEGGVRFSLDEDEVTLYKNGEIKTRRLSGSRSTSFVDNIAGEQEAFLRGVVEGEQPTRNTVEQALTVQRVMDSIYRSSETGHTVRIEHRSRSSTPVEMR